MLRLSGVTVRYPGAPSNALTGLDLSVGPGEVVALVGPSGAGKSTILGLAAGLVLPTEGSVEVFGVDSRVLGRRANRQTRTRIATIHQSFALVGPLRVVHNVAAGRLGRWNWLAALRSLVRPKAIDEIVATLDSVGIAEKLWERTDRLSGGQQQRAAIARALFQHPDLLLADEPCSALDPARADSVMAVLAAAVRSPVTAGDPSSNGQGESGRALVTSLHDAPLAVRHCDRVIGLRDGLVEFDLPSAEVGEARLADLYALEKQTKP